MAATATEAFITELKRWRDVRGLSQTALASKVGYNRSYVSKVETGQQRPSDSFSRQADSVLRAGGALLQAYRDLMRAGANEDIADIRHETLSYDQPASLVVEHDDAELRYDGRNYRAIMRRRLRNNSDHPVTRYLIRISVDRFPGNPERSNQLYREDPLAWDELDLQAQCGDDAMSWTVQHDRDAFKEVWLCFKNDTGRFPLYPGESTTIQYAYTVSDKKWGHWFQRAVRLPTERLSVRLVLPADLDPSVWGMQTTMMAEAFPLPTAVVESAEDGFMIYDWSTETPPLHARYRLEWRFKARDENNAADHTASRAMQALGIVQEDDPILSKATRPFELPTESDDARRVITELQAMAIRVAEVHTFGKGMGIAAPQIGIDRSAAIVKAAWLRRVRDAAQSPDH